MGVTPTTPPSTRPPTRADLEGLPENVIGEIIEGTLYTSPRPRGRHAVIITAISGQLFGPFHAGRGGLGGWWILAEPGLELPDSPEIVPDVAGWRRERLSSIPDVIQTAPDWVCEVLSPSTRWLDLRKKRPFYARIGVPFMWLVDPDAKVLTVSKNLDGRWSELASFVGDERIRAEPFDTIEIDLAEWWQLTTAPAAITE